MDIYDFDLRFWKRKKMSKFRSNSVIIITISWRRLANRWFHAKMSNDIFRSFAKLLKFERDKTRTKQWQTRNGSLLRHCSRHSWKKFSIFFENKKRRCTIVDWSPSVTRIHQSKKVLQSAVKQPWNDSNKSSARSTKFYDFY